MTKKYGHTTGLISSASELVENIRTVEKYLQMKKNSTEFKKMASLIQRGRNLVAYIVDGEYHFAPSRFVGYTDNSIEKHTKNINNANRNGIESTRVISHEILHDRCLPSDYLEKKYVKYCTKLGVSVHKRDRAYWSIDSDFEDSIVCSQDFFEGQMKIAVHERRERDAKVVKLAKDLFIKKHKRLYCEICGFDFEKTYGERGEGFIHAHHKIPMSERVEDEYKIVPQDFIMVCPNCHAMLHKALNGAYPTIDELKGEYRN